MGAAVSRAVVAINVTPNNRFQPTRKSGAGSSFFLAFGAPLLRSAEPKRSAVN